MVKEKVREAGRCPHSDREIGRETDREREGEREG